MPVTRGWTLREILIVTVIGAVFAVLYLGWVQVWLIAQAIFGSVTMDVVMGFWFVASIVAAAIIRKPGVAFAAEVLAAAVQVLLGSPAGLLLLVTGVVQGAGAEAVFAATRWRNYSLPVLMAAGVGAAIFSFAYTWIRFDYGALQPTVLIAMFVLRCSQRRAARRLARPRHRAGALQNRCARRSRDRSSRSALPQPEPAPAAAEWNAVEIRYPFAKRAAVGPVDLTIRPGERVLLLGPSGSGKSTLLLTLTGLIPDSIPAEVAGRVSLFGDDVGTRKPWGWAPLVAQYFQDADQTLCGMRVEDEIAFALENRAWPPERILEAVSDVMRRVGIPDAWRQRRSAQLSGGERQLVALAATLIQDAPLFVADEPTAHLAPEAARRLHALLTIRDRDRSVLIVDHRLDGLIESIDRMIVLGREGTIVAEGEPRKIFRDKRALLEAHGIWRPAASALDAALAEAGLASPAAPLSVAEALAHLDPATAPRRSIDAARPVVESYIASCRSQDDAAAIRNAPVLVRLEHADCAPFLGPTVLRGIDLSIHEGEILGVLGRNGAGKSTLGSVPRRPPAAEGGTTARAGGRLCLPAAGEPARRRHRARGAGDGSAGSPERRREGRARCGSARTPGASRSLRTIIRSSSRRARSAGSRLPRSPSPIAGRSSCSTSRWRVSMRMAPRIWQRKSSRCATGAAPSH